MFHAKEPACFLNSMKCGSQSPVAGGSTHLRLGNGRGHKERWLVLRHEKLKYTEMWENTVTVDLCTCLAWFLLFFIFILDSV